MTQGDPEGKIVSLLENYLEHAITGVQYSKLFSTYTLKHKIKTVNEQDLIVITATKKGQIATLKYWKNDLQNPKSFDLTIELGKEKNKPTIILTHRRHKKKWLVCHVAFSNFEGSFTKHLKSLNVTYSKDKKTSVEYVKSIFFQLEKVQGEKKQPFSARFYVKKNRPVTITKEKKK